MHLWKLALPVVATLSTAATASNILIYSNDFDNSPSIASGVSASVTGANYTPIAAPVGGFSGNYLSNVTKGNPAGLTEFSFANLPAHTSIDVNFLVAFIDSWDGSGSGQFEGDFLNVLIDGTSVGTLSVCNYNNSSCLQVLGGTQTAKGFYFNNPMWIDQVVDLSASPALSFAHTASTLTFGLRAFGAGWQGGNDESWGIDNLSITAVGAPLPEPASWAMMIGGLGMMGSALRRRAKTGLINAAA